MTTEEQHIEELLKPRIKVIAGTPYSGSLEVGEIVYADKDGKYYVYEDNGRWELHPDGYPHLFRVMEWWEDRKPEDMPQYVRLKQISKVLKVVEYGGQDYSAICINIQGDINIYYLRNLLPVTES